MVNTDSYLALGLTVVMLIVGGYTVSLLFRFRQARSLIAMLDTLKEEK